MNTRQYQAIRHKKSRREREIEADEARAAERAAIALGLCPKCGAAVIMGAPHAEDCEVRRRSHHEDDLPGAATLHRSVRLRRLA